MFGINRVIVIVQKFLPIIGIPSVRNRSTHFFFKCDIFICSGLKSCMDWTIEECTVVKLGSSNTINSTAWINTPGRYMADARCAMNLRGTFLVFVYGTKPRRQNRNCVKLFLAPEPRSTKHSGTDGKVTRFLMFAAWSPRDLGPNVHFGGTLTEFQSSCLDVVAKRKP